MWKLGHPSPSVCERRSDPHSLCLLCAAQCSRLSILSVSFNCIFVCYVGEEVEISSLHFEQRWKSGKVILDSLSKLGPWKVRDWISDLQHG